MADQVQRAANVLQAHREEILDEILRVQETLVPRIADVPRTTRAGQLVPILNALEHLLFGSAPEILVGVARDLVEHRLRQGFSFTDMSTLTHCHLIGLRRALVAGLGPEEGLRHLELIEEQAVLPGIRTVGGLFNELLEGQSR